jgi:soluble lytic murein transglycosylase-like protein
MNRETTINPFSAHAGRFLFTISAVFTLFAHSIYEAQRYTLPVSEKQMVFNQAAASRVKPAEQITSGQPEVNPSPVKMPDESSVTELPSSPSEKNPIVSPENSPSPVHGKRAERLFHPLILQAANRHKIDPDLVRAIIMAESSYNPKAISKKGARGLMQLMPRTAEALGIEDVFDPEHNINAGVKYFKQLLNQFNGDIKLALAAYNAGSGNVRRYQGIPPFKATKIYVKKVFEYYNSYKELAEAMNRA